MQLVGGEVENLIDVGHGEVACGDAVIAGENAVENEPRALREALAKSHPGTPVQVALDASLQPQTSILRHLLS